MWVRAVVGATDRSCAHHLVRQHKHRLDRELPAAKVEQVLQAGSQKVDDHDVIIAFDSIPVDVGDPDYST